ncbi:TrkH family potassium uptake protein [Eubacterium sp. OM08-24]|jgi:trk system potassium uptake protein TrkH|uniref:TrkH family potassium uptake protein n=1 Tax=Eubacterium sp. OM08-24 TaxID=2292352 RepID=UPI000E449EAB|nr:TrkH family potassium uptake protein [Eubacterium sp. OM08-24]RGM17013.1 TrkH family potassium uptake protein [Eubacterium sp. OM08-24]
MNKRSIIYILGWVLIVDAVAMQIGTITSLIYGEKEAWYFVLTGVVSAILGVLAIKVKKPKNMVLYQKAGFASTALSWILLSLVGCMPFWLSGEIPSFIDAFYETVSGITTTGATILNDVEALSKGMLMWRSFLHWLGGMGVIVFLLAIIPKLGGQQNIFLMKAESPGPIIGKAVPRMRNYATMLYGIYITLTALEFILLLFGGLNVFEAINTSFSTAGTGGFGIYNSNAAAFDSYYVQMVIAVFMLLFGVNFSVYLCLIARKFKQSLKFEELWIYLGIVAVSTAIIAFNISSIYKPYDAFHQSFFYVTSIISTTGFGLTDVNKWPELSKTIIIILTFIGASAGSTGGGFKISRIILLFKEVRKEFSLLVHPRNVKLVKMDGKAVNHDIMRTTSMYLVLYIGVFAISFLLVSIDNMDFTTSFTAVAANLNNTGPGLGAVGPVGNYADFSILSKIVFIFDMLAGRLEIYPLLLLFAPSAWKKS